MHSNSGWRRKGKWGRARALPPPEFSVFVLCTLHFRTLPNNRLLNNYSSSARWIWAGYNHLIYNKRLWNNCFVNNAHKISRILTNFICKNNRFSAYFLNWVDAYSYHLWRAWYKGSYTMMAKANQGSRIVLSNDSVFNNSTQPKSLLDSEDLLSYLFFQY